MLSLNSFIFFRYCVPQFFKLSLTETWLCDYNNTMCNFIGYSHIHKLREKNRVVGVVSMETPNWEQMQVQSEQIMLIGGRICSLSMGKFQTCTHTGPRAQLM